MNIFCVRLAGTSQWCGIIARELIKRRSSSERTRARDRAALISLSARRSSSGPRGKVSRRTRVSVPEEIRLFRPVNHRREVRSRVILYGRWRTRLGGVDQIAGRGGPIDSVGTSFDPRQLRSISPNLYVRLFSRARRMLRYTRQAKGHGAVSASGHTHEWTTGIIQWNLRRDRRKSGYALCFADDWPLDRCRSVQRSYRHCALHSSVYAKISEFRAIRVVRSAVGIGDRFE